MVHTGSCATRHTLGRNLAWRLRSAERRRPLPSCGAALEARRSKGPLRRCLFAVPLARAKGRRRATTPTAME